MASSTHLGKYISSTREKRGWTRKELAARAGVPSPTLRHIEDSKKPMKPKEETLHKIAMALGENDDERAQMEEILRLLAGYKQPPHLGMDEQNDILISILRARPDWAGVRDLFLRLPEEQRDTFIDLVVRQLQMLGGIPGGTE